MVGPSTGDASSAAGNGVELLGSGAQNLPTNLPKPGGGFFGVNDVFQPQTLLSTTQRDLPLLRFYIGRNDTAVLWRRAAPRELSKHQRRRVSDGAVLQSGATVPAADGLVIVPGLTLFKDLVRTRLVVKIPGALPPTPSAIISNANGPIELRCIGEPAQDFLVEATTNFTQWTPLGTLHFTSSAPVIFPDPNAALFPRRFYRLRFPGPP